MLNIIMISVGLICITLSIIYINKVSRKEKDIYEELICIHNNIKDYYFEIEKTMNSFEELIDNSLDKLTDYEKFFLDKNSKLEKLHKKKNDKTNRYPIITMENDQEMMKKDGELYKNIQRMRSQGCSPEVIAKKLNMGVREVEIIMKLKNKF